eukprot:12407644-Karenia_brevis.AAC.1
MTRVTSRPYNLWRSSLAFSRRHDLSDDLDMRLVKTLEATHYQCIGEIAEEESMLLNSVPPSLREDL